MYVKTLIQLVTAAAGIGPDKAANFTPGAATSQAANFILPGIAYSAYGCGDECQSALSQALPSDMLSVGLEFDRAFYATAPNFTSRLPPGEVLKLETLDANKKLLVSSGTSLFRMQYTSRDLDGSVVPATAFIALPQARSARDDGAAGLPVVAWAHGTVGLFTGCAPSNGPDLYDYGTWQPLVQRGYAVVATDYAGLGSNHTPHRYLSHRAHLEDVFHSVVAARRALGGAVLGDRWMAAGHSQGGGAVWKLAESALVRDDAAYLGTVALAPATYVVDMFLDRLADGIPAALLGYFTYFPFALSRGRPGFDGSALAAPPMRLRLRLAERAQVCIGGMFAMVRGLGRSDVVDEGAAARGRGEMLAWQRENSAAQGDRSPAPVLVVQGEADTTVLMGTTRKAWQRACEAGNEVHLRLYEGQEHSATPEAAAPEWLGWIDERFYGRVGAARNCTEQTRSPHYYYYCCYYYYGSPL